MTAPTCTCGKRGTAARREWPALQMAKKFTVVLTRVDWMEGFRCKRCGSWWLPFLPPRPEAERLAQEREWERLRTEGIAFDESLDKERIAI